MPALLPQDDPDKAGRDAILAAKRREYRYSYTINPPLAMSDGLPRDERPPLGWGKASLDALRELIHNDRRSHHALRGDRPVRRILEEGFHLAEQVLESPETLMNDLMSAAQGGLLGGRPKSVEDYATLFQTIPLPPIAQSFSTDAAFARNFLAASNPLILETVPGPGDRFPVSEAQYRRAMGDDDSLAGAGAEGRLLLADYGMLEGAACASYEGSAKYVYAPLALFAIARGDRRLVPVAIQLEQRPGEGNPIFTPADGVAWSIARTIVMIADANVSALWFHQARTHMIVEPIVLATHRQLAPTHPLHRLLVPHFVGTININHTGQRTVFAPGGTIEVLSGAAREAWRGLAVAAVRSYPFEHTFPEGDFERRGVADAERLPDYPYRDDARLLWDAIRSWTEEYVGLSYASEAAVQGDGELQAWLREIASPEGGRLEGLGENGGVETRAYLARVLASVVFMASAQHWALNGPLATLMAYVPNYPLAGYAPRPQSASGLGESDWLDQLPPLDQAQRQFDAAYLMGRIAYTRLGEYPADQFGDGPLADAAARFARRLSDVEAEIGERNRTRVEPYPFLLPSGIPQSINI